MTRLQGIRHLSVKDDTLSKPLGGIVTSGNIVDYGRDSNDCISIAGYQDVHAGV